MLHQLGQLFRRKRIAQKIGVAFKRTKKFSVPSSLRINGSDVPLKCPDEPGMRTAFIDILLDDCYELERMRQRNVDHIIDVGANVGLFSIAARIAFPLASIHAYEPNQNLKQFYDSNSLNFEFNCFPRAVGITEGWCNLDENNDSVLSRTIFGNSGNIEVQSLSSVIEKIGKPVDLLKWTAKALSGNYCVTPMSFKTFTRSPWNITSMNLTTILPRQHCSQMLVLRFAGNTQYTAMQAWRSQSNSKINSTATDI